MKNFEEEKQKEQHKTTELKNHNRLETVWY